MWRRSVRKINSNAMAELPPEIYENCWGSPEEIVIEYLSRYAALVRPVKRIEARFVNEFEVHDYIEDLKKEVSKVKKVTCHDVIKHITVMSLMHGIPMELAVYCHGTKEEGTAYISYVGPNGSYSEAVVGGLSCGYNGNTGNLIRILAWLAGRDINDPEVEEAEKLVKNLNAKVVVVINRRLIIEVLIVRK